MTAPRGLMGAALLVWGLSVSLPWVGAVLGIAVEALRFAPPSSSPRGARRVVLAIRFVALVALANLVYAVVTGQMPQALYTWLKWLPLIALPLPLVQWHAGGAIPSNAFVEALGAHSREAPREVDTTHFHVALTLIGAGTGSLTWFYAAAALLVSWAIAASIPRRRWAVGAPLLAAAITAGFAIQTGLSALQGEVEDVGTELLADFFAPKPDPFRERTRIGDLGRIKLSDRILMRVIPLDARPPALLLREAVFERYRNGEWQSARRAFRRVLPTGQGWLLRDGNASHRVTLRRSIPGGEGLLALPAGAQRVERLAAESLAVSPTGTVLAKGTPRFVSIDVAYDEERELDPPFASEDLDVPEVLTGALDRVVTQSTLRRATDRETLAAVEGFFAEKFSYSLNLSDPKDGGKSRTIADFLLRDHKGHCEYFATGTVLLLRRAGIPARYTVGYSAQEYSEREGAFLVRNRHAHAWASAFIDGRWIFVDTTPARWAEMEGEAARSMFGAWLDAASWIVEKVVQAWLARSAGELLAALASTVGLAVLAALALVLARRWRRRARGAARTDTEVTRVWHALERKLAKRGFTRDRDETALAWAQRLCKESPLEPWRQDLVKLARHYYRARFDPAHTPGDDSEFISAASRWKSPR